MAFIIVNALLLLKRTYVMESTHPLFSLRNEFSTCIEKSSFRLWEKSEKQPKQRITDLRGRGKEANDHKEAKGEGKNPSKHLNHGCNGPVDFKNTEILAKVQCKTKKQAEFLLKIREGMNIRCHQTGPGKGLNENWGNLPTRQWDPLFADIRNNGNV